jgi:hypothetical protein
MVLVPSHRSSSFLEACACTPEAPATRRTAHPIRKALTTPMRCPLLLDLAGAYKPHHYQEGRHHR